MPRKDLTLSSKIALLDKIKTLPVNISYRKIADITGVPRSTISRLLQQENQLREEWSVWEGRNGISKRKRDGKDPEVEEALDQWFSVVNKGNMNICGSVLKQKAEEIAKSLEHNEFKATNGWLSRWKARHNVSFKKEHNENVYNKATEQWKNTTIPTSLEKFCADDIYNADETSLYYRDIPDEYLNRTSLSNYKKATERITVLCCANMSGGDKRELLIVGKSTKPRCFQDLITEALPVEYHANKNAYITSEIFQNWLTRWDLELQYNQKKIILLLNNSVAHLHLDDLKNIKLEFLPPNTTTSGQPINIEITKNLKTLYHEKLVNYVQECIDENETNTKISLLQALHFIADCWRELNTNIIQNSFVTCGFKSLEILHPLKIEENQDDIKIESISTSDDNLQCFNEKAIDTANESIESKRLKINKADDAGDDFSCAPVTQQEAKKCIAKLQRYFLQDGNEDSPMSALTICADFVQLQSQENKK
ncbi:tigger transposable element-derived protein 6-like [Onthophagus taurus]|uniref:tigger transposable element-derived protein 6-like n=1 Tax=Onthophagus taurus TaxID=166361 RepID=UPI0039BE26DB